MNGQFGPPPVPLRPLVDEAVHSLGYFRPDAVDELTDLLTDLWPKGVSGTMLSSGMADHLLSERGLMASYHAKRSTLLRIIAGTQRARFEANANDWRSLYARLKLSGRSNFTCAFACEKMGMIVAAEDRFRLPLPGCTSEWCSCRWDGIITEV